MAFTKPKVEPIEIEDEVIFSPRPPAEPTAGTVSALEAQNAHKPPSMADVLAYWTPGRERTMEVPQLIAEHSVKCAKCEAMLPYIPERDKPAPTLICDSH